MKRTAGLIALLVITLLLSTSCKDITSDTDVSKSRILDILDGIETAFDQRDTDAIMRYFHEDYLHKGRTLTLERQTWELRLGDYVDLQIEDAEVEIDGSYATVSFNMLLTNSDGTDTFLEPYEHGDFSYFYKEDGVWKVYGNQENYGTDSGYDLYIDSDPANARVYVNDAPMFQYTPLTLYDLPEANYRIRLYKEGYNEYQITINVPEELVIDHAFTTSTLPRPVFEILHPTDGQHVTNSLAAVEGTIRTQYDQQTLGDFDGTEYILSVNDVETVVQSLGEVLEYITLHSGQNVITLRATGAAGNTGVSDPVIVYGDF